jgi:hypothetical protein
MGHGTSVRRRAVESARPVCLEQADVRVGFVGLGRMGSGMARRLLDAGHDLAVYNRSVARTVPFAAAGARVATSLADLAAGCDVVFSMLVDDAAVQEVTTAPGGLREVLAHGALHVAMGTHGVAQVRALAAAHGAAGQGFVAAPVLGRPDRAASGQLGIIAGGATDQVERAVPLFEILGTTLFRAGERPEAAAVLKIANNFLLGAAIEALAEGMALVRSYDVAPALLQQVLTEGIFDCLAYRVYGRIMVDESYDQVGVTARVGLKDAELALAAADPVAVPLPSAELLRARLAAVIEHGDGARDWAVLAREQARASGLE